MTHYTDTSVVDPSTIPALAAERARIPDALFREVLAWLPIMTADFIPTRVNNGTREFLLGLRAEEPFKGTWFVTGGRLNWGETTPVACKRHLERELGITNIEPVYIGQVSVINPESKARPLWHSIWNLHEVPVTMDTVVIISKTDNAKVAWFSKIQPEFPDPVKEALRMLGFK